ncbi:Retrovirus-related Pol polyprotein from transposon RE1 [Vitis vinifera]|uniref:Retrovirus-related Pol polyprotein from transposon RE1 n=1 Tax=Vitis vinifera TaxID=29760 RepID=A0A438FKV0_VITVI|nr:Retrovirus-related Pol polyprotein from transposon RE1 [Vitis vinifera]
MEVAGSRKRISISQRKYILDLLTETSMLGCKPSDTPIRARKRTKSDGKPVDRERYQRLVGRLICLSHTRPNIAFAVSVVSQYMHSPKESHLEVVYKILRYLKGSLGRGLFFKKGDSDRLVAEKKREGLICKLDIEKAYDNINWKFLLKVLQKWALDLSGWGGCGVACLQPNSQFWLMGFQLAFSQALRGLDKEIPHLPPLCYGMEVLDVLIRRAVEGGFLSRCSIRGGSRSTLNISHLFFTDDTIVLCEASKEHLTHLSWILLWFEAASGLRINLAKSEIIPVGEVDEIEELVVELGCRWDPCPLSIWVFL